MFSPELPLCLLLWPHLADHLIEESKAVSPPRGPSALMFALSNFPPIVPTLPLGYKSPLVFVGVRVGLISALCYKTPLQCPVNRVCPTIFSKGQKLFFSTRRSADRFISCLWQ